MGGDIPGGNFPGRGEFSRGDFDGWEGRLGRILNVLCTFNLRLVST